MKFKHTLAVAFTLALSFACAEKSGSNTAVNAPKPAASNATTSVTDLPMNATPAPTPKDGDYAGKGVVTKINMELGSIEMNHEEIKDLMPAMKMEFFVSDKKLLDGFEVGDKVDFVIRYKDRNETIVKITKTS